jgi:pyruvate kinase
MATLTRNLRLKYPFDEADGSKLVRLTKIVCTIGPKTKSVEMLENLLDRGMNVMRLNFSHGTHEYHGEVVDNLRAALRKRGPDARCAIMLDTKGPEIRTGKLKDKTVRLAAGQEIEVGTDNTVPGDEKLISLDYKDLVDSVQVGGHILIADGQISLSIKTINKDRGTVTCIVNNNSVLGENKNVHLPGAKVNLPAVSEKDKQDLIFGIEKKVDLIAASFIRSKDDIRQIKEVLGDAGRRIKLISKIESTEGLENFDSILEVSDGIMVARGDLGVELPMEHIFIAQKMIVSKCNAAGKPVITATQMLESMIQNPRPTRAEATDVANAVLDGTDAVMLSGETASGDYPLEAVAYMSKICLQAERVESQTDYPSLFEGLRAAATQVNTPEVVCAYAVRSALDLKASMIITITETGSTARLVCKYRPRVPVICVTNSPDTAHYLLLTRAAFPFVVGSILGSEHLVRDAMEDGKRRGVAKSGDTVLVIHGIIEGVAGNSNSLKVLTVA